MKEKCKRADNKNRFQEEDQQCCQQHGGHDINSRDSQQHGGHDMNSRDMQCKSELERLEARMCKVAQSQANCDVHCKRETQKKCESNNVATAQRSKQRANKMQEREEEEEREGIECSSLIEQHGGGEERIELDHLVDDARKRRTAGRICNNKESYHLKNL